MSLPKSPTDLLAAASGTIDQYQAALNRYTDHQFVQKPSETDWSIGQVCTHLMDGWYGFFSKKIEKCLESKEFAEESLNENGVFLLENGRFPASRIQGPAASTYIPQAPPSRAIAIEQFETLRNKMEDMAVKLATANVSGRRHHPAFGYLDAWQWFELAEIHLRHHLMQKERIDAFLGN